MNDADCGGPGPLLCQYKIADGCAATGHCVRIVVPTCKGFVELCGCGGGWVESECAYQPGYASGSTTGAPYPMCPGDGGI